MLRWFAPSLAMLLAAAMAPLAPAPAVPGAAGKGVVITLDRAPQGLEVGVPFAVGFTIRATTAGEPATALEPLVVASNPATEQSVTVAARPASAQGHYEALLIFPTPGEWEWHILPEGPGGEPVAMPPLEVAEAGAAAGRRALPDGLLWLLLAGAALLPPVVLEWVRRGNALGRVEKQAVR